MQANAILEYLSKHGQQVDYEIAAAMQIPLADVRTTLSALSKRGEISRCNVTRFVDGKPLEGMLCRISGTIPPKAPGRKPSA